MFTVEPPNNVYSGDGLQVHFREVIFISADTKCTCMIQSVGGKQFVSSTEVVRFSECPLSDVPLYIHVRMHV